jgi:hypothetical protein
MKLASRILFSLTLALVCAAPALAQTTHSVWSDKPLMVRDWSNHKEYKTVDKGDAAFA